MASTHLIQKSAVYILGANENACIFTCEPVCPAGTINTARKSYKSRLGSFRSGLHATTAFSNRAFSFAGSIQVRIG